MQVRRIKGFADILYPESERYTYIEQCARDIFSRYMYQELRPPLAEYTELFVRGIGTTTDVVQKEMYTFADKKGRSISLRPEATAGVVRAYIENAMQGLTKVFTLGPMFRYERPQKGRMRQFHQINCECLGEEAPDADAEIISMLIHLLHSLGITDIELLLNSLGCEECRSLYKAKLLDYIALYKEKLCVTCQERSVHNPLRILDCKEKECQQTTQDAPSILDFLCASCNEHFTQVQTILSELHIPYTITPRLVRGLDYYSRTTFEVISKNIGAQSSIAGGGRYDSLVQQIGGKATPAIGFACGMERLLLLLEGKKEEKIPYYIAPLCESAQQQARYIAHELRHCGIKAEFSFHAVTIKQCMKYAGKHAVYCIMIGEDEMKEQYYSIKNMNTGEQERVPASLYLTYCKEQMRQTSCIVNT